MRRWVLLAVLVMVCAAGAGAATCNNADINNNGFTGGTQGEDDFNLWANCVTFDEAHTGRIILHERVILIPENVTFSIAAQALISTPNTAVYTVSADVAPVIIKHGAEFKYTADAATPTVGIQIAGKARYTVSQSDSHMVEALNAGVSYLADGSGVTVTMDPVGSILDTPSLGAINGGTFAGTYVGFYEDISVTGVSAGALASWIGYRFGTEYDGDAFGTILAFEAEPNQSGGDFVGYRILYGATGGTSVGFQSDIPAGTGNRFLDSSGTAVSTIKGAVRIGDTTAPTKLLEVLGDVLVASDTTGRTLCIREPSGSGTNQGCLDFPAAAGDGAISILPLTGNMAVTTGALTSAHLAAFDSSGRIVDGGAAPNVPKVTVLSSSSDVSIASTSEVQVLSGSVGTTSGKNLAIQVSVKMLNSASANRSYTGQIRRGGTACSDATAVTDGDGYAAVVAQNDRRMLVYSATEASPSTGTQTYRLCVLSSSATGTQTTEYEQLTFVEF